MNRVKEIIKDETSLSDWCLEVDTRKEGKLVQEIILALKDTMRENSLQYLTAPQIGYNKRIFCLRFGDSDYRTFINPAIENNTGITLSRETCNSIDGKEFIIPRFGKLKLWFTTPLGKVESAQLIGKAAFVFQHALDHLNGSLVSDIGLEIDEMFDNATDEEREEVVNMYLESLDLRMKELQKEIEQDEDLKQIDDAAKFITSVKNGSTVLYNPDNNEETKDQ